MQANILEEVVLDQQALIKRKEIGLKRDYDIEKLVSTKQITVISGIRRCGKSTLMRQLTEYFPDFYYCNFDDERLLNFTVEGFRELMIILKKHGKSNTVFFDEIQNIEGWERFIRRIFDEGYKIFITGSNSKLLSSELATHLTGRYIKVELYPFSFKEVLRFRGVDSSKLTSDNQAEILKHFDAFLNKGSFPEILKYGDDEFVKRVYEDIIYKDLVARFGIRNIKQFKKLSQYLFTNFTGELSYNALKTILSIKSANTVSEYVSYLEESYLVFELYKFDYSMKRQFISDKKVYVADNGMRNQVAFRFSEDHGKLLENSVFLELKRRSKELYFLKTKTKREIDFLYHEDAHYELIQVTMSMQNPKTRQRELASIIETYLELPSAQAKILTYNEEETILLETGQTIEVLPVWKWMIR